MSTDVAGEAPTLKDAFVRRAKERTERLARLSDARRLEARRAARRISDRVAAEGLAERVVSFGSRTGVDGTVHPDSDIALALFGVQPGALVRIGQLVAAETRLPADIVVAESADPELRARIDRGGKVLTDVGSALRALAT